MEYISTAFLALFTQLFLGYSDIDYTPAAGVMLSEYTRFTDFKAKSILTGNRVDQHVIKTQNYAGVNTVDYDLFLDNIIPYSEDSNIWFGTRLSWSPSKQAAQVRLRSPTASNANTKLYRYMEGPAFGLLVGYNVKNYDPNRVLSVGINPFFGVSIMQAGYAGLDDEIQSNHSSVTKFSGGVKLAANNTWDFVVDVTYFNVEMRGIEGNGQDINLRVLKYRAGFAYNFKSDLVSRRSMKDVSYDDIIKEIDPRVRYRQELSQEDLNNTQDLESEDVERDAPEVKEEVVEESPAVEEQQPSSVPSSPPSRSSSAIETDNTTSTGDSGWIF